MMESILRMTSILSAYTMLITPLTLIVGVINAIKKPKKDAMPYTIMAIISAYLIIIPIMAILFDI